LDWTEIMGLSAGPGLTLNGHILISLCTEASLYLRPISLLASAHHEIQHKDQILQLQKKAIRRKTTLLKNRVRKHGHRHGHGRLLTRSSPRPTHTSNRIRTSSLHNGQMRNHIHYLKNVWSDVENVHNLCILHFHNSIWLCSNRT